MNQTKPTVVADKDLTIVNFHNRKALLDFCLDRTTLNGKPITKPTPDWDKGWKLLVDDTIENMESYSGKLSYEDELFKRICKIGSIFIHQAEQEARKDSQASLLERVVKIIINHMDKSRDGVILPDYATENNQLLASILSELSKLKRG